MGQLTTQPKTMGSLAAWLIYPAFLLLIRHLARRQKKRSPWLHPATPLREVWVAKCPRPLRHYLWDHANNRELPYPSQLLCWRERGATSWPDVLRLNPHRLQKNIKQEISGDPNFPAYLRGACQDGSFFQLPTYIWDCLPNLAIPALIALEKHTISWDQLPPRFQQAVLALPEEGPNTDMFLKQGIYRAVSEADLVKWIGDSEPKLLQVLHYNLALCIACIRELYLKGRIDPSCGEPKHLLFGIKITPRHPAFATLIKQLDQLAGTIDDIKNSNQGQQYTTVIDHQRVSKRIQGLLVELTKEKLRAHSPRTQ